MSIYESLKEQLSNYSEIQENKPSKTIQKHTFEIKEFKILPTTKLVSVILEVQSHEHDYIPIELPKPIVVEPPKPIVVQLPKLKGFFKINSSICVKICSHIGNNHPELNYNTPIKNTVFLDSVAHVSNEIRLKNHKSELKIHKCKLMINEEYWLYKDEEEEGKKITIEKILQNNSMNLFVYNKSLI